jgi:hypothetical protein
MSEEITTTTKEVYNFLDFLGDIGGVADIIVIFFSFLVGDFAYQLFYILAIRKFYEAVRTKHEDVFQFDHPIIKDCKTFKLGSLFMPYMRVNHKLSCLKCLMTKKFRDRGLKSKSYTELT